jgi:phosphatidylglycerol:prolipoprotein diacylglycerol transferase
VLTEIGPFQVFGIFFALNFVGWGAVAAVRLRELRRPEEWAYEMVFVAVAGGVVGAKLYWAIENGELGIGDLLSGSGLTWYGGLIGGALAMLVWARRRGMPYGPLADMAAFCLPIGYAIGRVGCQISGDGDYGGPTDVPWAMAFPEGVVPTTQEVHPSPIYESISMALVGLVLWHLRDRFRPGVLFALYALLAGLERFLVEFVRRNEEVVAGLTGAQLWALGLVVAGTAGLAVAASRGAFSRPAAPA